MAHRFLIIDLSLSLSIFGKKTKGKKCKNTHKSENIRNVSPSQNLIKNLTNGLKNVKELKNKIKLKCNISRLLCITTIKWWCWNAKKINLDLKLFCCTLVFNKHGVSQFDIFLACWYNRYIYSGGTYTWRRLFFKYKS